MNLAQRASVLLIAAIFAAGVSAQTFVYPAKGQSPDKQKKDEAECHTWAVQQSKYDPANPPPPPAAATPPTTATGTTPGAGCAVRPAARWWAKSSAMTPVPAQQLGGGRARPEPAPEHGAVAAATAGRHPATQAGMAAPEGARGVPRRSRLFRQVAAGRRDDRLSGFQPVVVQDAGYQRLVRA